MRRALADPDLVHAINISAYSEADTIFRAGRYREALKLFKAALDADPSDGDAWHAIGSCYDALGMPAKAASAYRSAMPRLPAERHPDLHFNIGNAHLDLGEYEAALEKYELVPKSSRAWASAAKNRALARLADRG